MTIKEVFDNLESHAVDVEQVLRLLAPDAFAASFKFELNTVHQAIARLQTALERSSRT